MPVLVTLGDRMERWPGYLSNVIFELWQLPGAEGKAGEFVVRVLYNQEDMALGDSSAGGTRAFRHHAVLHFCHCTVKCMH